LRKRPILSERARLLVLACSFLGCGGKNASAYQGAAGTAGLGVVAAGVNRHITGDCWANCPPGTRCDRDRGTCVELPCRGSCPDGKRCQRVGSMYECMYEGYFDRPATGPPDRDDAGVAVNVDAAADAALDGGRP